MSGLNTLPEMYDDYYSKVVPKDASPIQRRETKMAFYAGALAAVTQFERCGEPDISEEIAFRHMERWKRDCEAFFKDAIRRFVEGN